MSARIVLGFLIFFLSHWLLAQGYDNVILETSEAIDGQAFDGFSTKIWFKEKDVEKGWWQYSREFGRPLRMRGYYQVTVSNNQSGNAADLKLLSKTTDLDSLTEFFLCLDTTGIPANTLTDYDDQVRTILEDFKKYYYLNELEEELEDAEKKAARIGKRIAKAPSRNREHQIVLLQQLQETIASTKATLRRIYQSD